MAKNQVAVKKKRNINNIAYLFVLPFVIVFLVFNVYPVLRTLYLSFTNYRGFGDAVWSGIDNYIRVLTDKFFWRSLWNTIKMWSLNIVLQLGIAFLLTIVFSDVKYRMRGLGVFRAVFYLPNLISATSVAFLFKTLLDWKYGSFNQMLLSIGIIDEQINWLGSSATAPWVISVIQTWMWFGNSFIMLMAGVQGISRDYFEAAAIDGAGRWTTFGKITLPLIRPIMLYVFITSLIGGLQLFDLPFLINGISGGTAGNPSGTLQTSVMYLYKFGFETNQVGYASAIAYTLFAIILIVSIIQFKTLGREDD
ncbi:MAG: sugar ABC transporter permease [Lachnospiraceae bacterium]|nr:sugar ABC transporter permease [Lachnospiraceae bacterium]